MSSPKEASMCPTPGAQPPGKPGPTEAAKPMAKRRFGRIFWRPGRPGSEVGTWAIRYRQNGRWVQKSIGPDFDMAEQALATVQVALLQEKHLGVRAIAPATFTEFRPTVKRLLEARLVPKSVACEMGRYGVLERHFGNRPLCDLGPADIEDFLSALQTKARNGHKKGNKPQTGNRYIALLNRVFKEAVDRAFARENPVARVRRVREEVRAVPFLDEADLARIAAAAKPWLRPLVFLAADTGLRRGELLGLQWRDIDFARSVLVVRHSKNKRPREVPLTDRARAVVGDLRAARGPVPLVGEDPMFTELAGRHPNWGPLSVSLGFRKAAKKAGFTGLRFHDLRHAFCSRLAQLGVPLSTVAILAGHSSLTVTNRYARHVPKDATREAIARLAQAAIHAAPMATAPVPASAGLATAEASA